MKKLIFLLFSSFILVSCGGSDSDPLNQGNNDADISNSKYDINVIFHVLYQNPQDALQYVDANRLSSILENTNRIFSNSSVYSIMNLEFSLATTDPNGNSLTTPGVEYIRWNESYPINENNFMGDNTGKYTYLVWDPNNYINIMVYNFMGRSINSSILGVAHLPYTTTGPNQLNGLIETPFDYLSKDNIKFPLSVSINSLYINQESSSSIYNPLDVNVTTAHELGHYLGLLHVFSEDSLNQCIDPDYCTDTPTYNRFIYDELLSNYISNNDQNNLTFSNLVNRVSCEGNIFESQNIMDYAISYGDKFSIQQANRVRHVLEYSPLIPGPKRISRSNNKINKPEGPIDLPIKYINKTHFITK